LSIEIEYVQRASMGEINPSILGLAATIIGPQITLL